MLTEAVQFEERSIISLKKRLISKDGTEKFIWQTFDNHSFETVLVYLQYRRIPRVICVSSQIGCPVKCRFCTTGTSFVRNLTDIEIIQQVTDVLKYKNDEWAKEKCPSFEISFMSMGEPFLNWSNVRNALYFFDHKFGANIEMTISTVGIAPRIYELGSESFSCNVDLQISLHAVNPKVRENLIPNCIYKVEEIIEAAECYSEISRRKVCINYLLLKDINDGKTDCQNLIKILDTKHFYVKLSQLNGQENTYFPADVKSAKMFESLLRSAGFETKMFKSYGTDINAGCGQLPSGLHT